MRVLLFSKVNPADGGGVQTVFRRLAASLRDRGDDVVQAWSRPDPADERSATIPLPVFEHGVQLRPAPAVAKAVAALAVRLRRWRPDLVNSHFVTSESAYFLALRPLMRHKVVLSIHGSDLLRPKPWDVSMVPRLLRHADAITTVSQLTAARIREIPGIDPSRVHVIPNGVDVAFWGAVEGPPLAERAPVVFSTGRLHPVKGHDVLIRAMPRVRDRVPDARLWLAGEGPCLGDLRQLAAGLGIADAVEFTGRLDRQDVRSRMSRARVFVLPSRSEGLPLALLEAMAAGLPVVATSVGGVPEVIDETMGALVAPEDPATLAEAIAVRLDRTAMASAQAALAAARARQFDAAQADERYASLFERLVTT